MTPAFTPGLNAPLRRFLLVVSLALLCGGLEFGGSLQPARVCFICALALSIVSSWTIIADHRTIRVFLGGAALWVTWGVASLLWTPDPAEGVKQVTGIALGILTVAAVVNLCAAETQMLDWLRRGWVAAFCGTLPVAFWEVVTGKHLPLAVEMSNNDPAGYCAATFGNRNMYEAFLGIALPMLLWSADTARSRSAKAVYYCGTTVAVALMFYNGARLGVITAIVEIFVWVLLKIAFGRSGRLMSICAALLLLTAGVVTLVASPHALTRMALLFGGGDASVGFRSNLFRNGLLLFGRSYGAGIGAGGFMRAMVEQGRNLYEVQSRAIPVVDAHNLWIEVLAEYGIVVFTWFAGVLLMITHALWRTLKLGVNTAPDAAKPALVLMAGLPMVCVMNSSFVTATIFWAAIGTLLATAAVSSHGKGASERGVRA